MFASEGFFSRVRCPFDGSCLRAHCMFRHDKTPLLNGSRFSCAAVSSTTDSTSVSAVSPPPPPPIAVSTNRVSNQSTDHNRATDGTSSDKPAGLADEFESALAQLASIKAAVQAEEARLLQLRSSIHSTAQQQQPTTESPRNRSSASALEYDPVDNFSVGGFLHRSPTPPPDGVESEPVQRSDDYEDIICIKEEPDDETLGSARSPPEEPTKSDTQSESFPTSQSQTFQPAVENDALSPAVSSADYESMAIGESQSPPGADDPFTIDEFPSSLDDLSRAKRALSDDEDPALQKRRCDQRDGDEQSRFSDVSKVKREPKAHAIEKQRSNTSEERVLSKLHKSVKNTKPVEKSFKELDFLSMEEGPSPPKSALSKKKKRKRKDTHESETETESRKKVAVTGGADSDTELEMTATPVIRPEKPVQTSWKPRVAHENSKIDTKALSRSISQPSSLPKPPARPSPRDIMQQRFALLEKLKSTMESPLPKPTPGGGGDQTPFVPPPDFITRASTMPNMQPARRTKSMEYVPPPGPAFTKSRVAHSGGGSDAAPRDKPPAVITASPSDAPPQVEIVPNSKIPTVTRQQYVNRFFEQYKRLTSVSEAHTKAAEAEKAIFEKGTTKCVYLNLCVNAIKKLKNYTQSSFSQEDANESKSPDAEPEPKSTASISHMQMLFGSKLVNTSQDVRKPRTAPTNPPAPSSAREDAPSDLFTRCEKYLLTDEQLCQNGYPGYCPQPAAALLLPRVSQSDRVCSRCGKTYTVDETSGLPVVEEECQYHWGKLWKMKVGGSLENRFRCCEGDVGAAPCSFAPSHVTDKVPTAVDESQFKRTKHRETPPPRGRSSFGVFSLDCEMCYTTQGLELTRVTVIDHTCSLVYESFVTPANPILDYNTRFSGISEEQLRHTKTTLADVQRSLLKIFSRQSILIGHSLESDLRALQIIHGRVVDTSVVFPHRQGLPYKRSLKNVTLEVLQKIIQDSEDGHDSREDAEACMLLMLHKVRQDSSRGR